MRPPEMSYSPAYHQAQDPVSSVPNPILAPRPRRSLEYPEQAHPGPLRPSDEWTPPCDVSPRSSGLRGSHVYSPEQSRRPSQVEDGLPVTRILVSSSGAKHKEERSRSSWADQPSLMSAEQVGTPRAQKRGVPEDASTDYGQDALLMLVSLYSSDHEHVLSNQLAVPTLCPCPDILPLRLSLHLLRTPLRNPLLASPSLPNITLPPQHDLHKPTLRPPLPIPPYPRTTRLHASTNIRRLPINSMDPLRVKL